MGKKTIMIFSILLLVLLVTAPAAVLRSAPLDCIFEHYSSEDGLSHNSISDIHQDRTGYIWLCTWYGLSRFDGNRFVNYTILPGDYTNLSHNRILSIDEDMAGALWITTYDYRLFRFDPVKEKFTAIPDDVMDMSLGNVQVKLFHCDRAGNTWVSLDGADLCRISPSLESKAYFGNGDNIVGRHVKAIYEDSDGAIYGVGTRDNSDPGRGAVSAFPLIRRRIVFRIRKQALFPFRGPVAVNRQEDRPAVKSVSCRVCIRTGHCHVP